jgi:hypothetical protein
MTVFVMKMHFAGEHGDKVPAWLRRLVLIKLASLLRFTATPRHPASKVFFLLT